MNKKRVIRLNGIKNIPYNNRITLAFYSKDSLRRVPLLSALI
nr:hypothetical protein [uncultured Lachnoclostridium sp.]